MMDCIGAFFPNYCVLRSKNDKPLNNKIIVYNYTCSTDNYKDILVATKLMLLYNCKILNSSFQKDTETSNIEWTFYTISSIQDVRNILKMNNRSNLRQIIDTIKFKNDDK
jgi:hypothetical protein